MSLPSSPDPASGAAILPFPAQPSADTPRDPGTHGKWCNIFYIARQLRLHSADPRTVVAHVRAHVRHRQFPLPVSSRLRGGVPVTGIAAVTTKAEWLRDAVDLWVLASQSAASQSASPGAPADRRAADIDAMLSQRLTRPPAHPAGASA